MLMAPILTASTERYGKLRGKASKTSRQRAAGVDLNPIHPLLLEHVNKAELALEKACEDIKQYRPSSTVWELERGRNSEVGVAVRSHRR